MKKGWIQANTNGVYEDVAPKTLADLVYMDDTQTETVKDALDNAQGNGNRYIIEALSGSIIGWWTYNGENSDSTSRIIPGVPLEPGDSVMLCLGRSTVEKFLPLGGITAEVNADRHIVLSCPRHPGSNVSTSVEKLLILRRSDGNWVQPLISVSLLMPSFSGSSALTLSAYTPGADTGAAPDSTIQARLDALYDLYQSIRPVS